MIKVQLLSLLLEVPRLETKTRVGDGSPVMQAWRIFGKFFFRINKLSRMGADGFVLVF